MPTQECYNYASVTLIMSLFKELMSEASELKNYFKTLFTGDFFSSDLLLLIFIILVMLMLGIAIL